MSFLFQVTLDHLVITTSFDLDRARDIFLKLGFTLAPRGEHAMGSVNHLILFEDSFLELIGVPRNGPVQRKEVLDAPKGIDGLVYRTSSADQLHAALSALHLPLQSLHSFGRFVERDGRVLEARFRTVRALPGTFEAGRVYYCQHLTPELIWLPELQLHRNGAMALVALTLVADDPRSAAERMAPWAGVMPEATEHEGFSLQTGTFRLDVTPSKVYRERYGVFCCEALGRGSYFGAIHIMVRDLDALGVVLAELAGATEFIHDRSDRAIWIRIPEFNTLLVFTAKPCSAVTEIS